jgi:hypothetical protein
MSKAKLGKASNKKGKTNKELYGEEKAKEIKLKRSKPRTIYSVTNIQTKEIFILKRKQRSK